MSSPSRQPRLVYREGDGSELNALEEYPAGEEFERGEDQDLEQLRWLLLAPEQEQIEQLRYRLDDPGQKAQEQSLSLAEAFALRLVRDRKLQGAFQPLFENAMEATSARDPKAFATWLLPAVGRALRSAISGCMFHGLAAVNDFLVRLISLDSLRWRFVSWRTGDSASMVALTRSRRYRVERVLLIHRETGLSLGQASAEGLSDAGAEFERIASIQAVNRKADKANFIEVIEVGERKLWLRHGDLALLALVVAGRPPAALNPLLESESETIHERCGGDLEDFDSDSDMIPGITGYLRGLLMLGTRKIGAKNSYGFVWALILLLLVSGGTLISSRFEEDQQWRGYVEELGNQPGIVVLETQRRWFGYSVRGLRDPLAVDPKTLLAASGLPASEVSQEWTPYLSLDPKFGGMGRLQGLQPMAVAPAQK